MQYINKILSGNRITLPSDFLKHNKLGVGDYLLLNTNDGRLIIRVAEIKPKGDSAE